MRDAASVIAAIAMRDGMRCYLCGQGRIEDEPFEIEHVRPSSAG